MSNNHGPPPSAAQIAAEQRLVALAHSAQTPAAEPRPFTLPQDITTGSVECLALYDLWTYEPERSGNVRRFVFAVQTKAPHWPYQVREVQVIVTREQADMEAQTGERAAAAAQRIATRTGVLLLREDAQRLLDVLQTPALLQYEAGYPTKCPTAGCVGVVFRSDELCGKCTRAENVQLRKLARNYLANVDEWRTAQGSAALGWVWTSIDHAEAALRAAIRFPRVNA